METAGKIRLELERNEAPKCILQFLGAWHGCRKTTVRASGLNFKPGETKSSPEIPHPSGATPRGFKGKLDSGRTPISGISFRKV